MAHLRWSQRPFFLLYFASFLSLISLVSSYEVPIRDTDYARQVCSGMWGGSSAYINVTFDGTSQGNLAMVIYEWNDVEYLGKTTPAREESGLPKIYVCTSSVVAGGDCSRDQLGQFILQLPAGKTVNDTSFWTARVQLPGGSGNSTSTTSGLWDNPDGNPTPPPNRWSSPWRRSLPLAGARRQMTPVGSDHILKYTEPIHYPVEKDGFYCVAAIPVTVSDGVHQTNAGAHPPYSGVVLFQNTFKGQLAATDYPKVTFYFIMFIVYAVFGAVWAWWCYQHIHDLLPIQYYISILTALLVIEMFANWVYYRYLNAHGRTTASTAFLIVVAILDAGRNSMSFFMLLVVSLGLSVVRESLGSTMRKCQLLTGAHFIFGILYAIGIVELELESTKALILLLFIVPLAFTLSGFLLWIMYALNGTIAHLRARKQKYKLKMFERLYYILLFAVMVIAAFFVVSTMSFSGRGAEDYSAKSWRLRWWLLDGWLALLYLTGFVLIAFLWRPTNLGLISTLAMSDEIAQDEEDAEDYDLEAIQHRSHLRDEDDEDDAATLIGGRERPGNHAVVEDHVVFEIGDEDDEDDDGAKKKRAARLSGENHRLSGEEGRGLMNGSS